MTPVDEVTAFIEDACIEGPTAGSVRLLDLYDRYAERCASEGRVPMRRIRFLEGMRRTGRPAWFSAGGWPEARVFRMNFKPDVVVDVNEDND